VAIAAVLAAATVRNSRLPLSIAWFPPHHTLLIEKIPAHRRVQNQTLLRLSKQYMPMSAIAHQNRGTSKRYAQAMASAAAKTKTENVVSTPYSIKPTAASSVV
jgi:hypothetical protein